MKKFAKTFGAVALALSGCGGEAQRLARETHDLIQQMQDAVAAFDLARAAEMTSQLDALEARAEGLSESDLANFERELLRLLGQGAGGAASAAAGGPSGLNGTWTLLAGAFIFDNGNSTFRALGEEDSGTYTVDGNSITLTHEDSFIVTFESRQSGNDITFFGDGFEL